VPLKSAVVQWAPCYAIFRHQLLRRGTVNRLPFEIRV
jgi:hypothetical protein